MTPREFYRQHKRVVVAAAAALLLIGAAGWAARGRPDAPRYLTARIEEGSITSDTRYLDERGKPIGLSQLRAGDTVFVRSRPGNGGAIALEIRKGPMTIAELQKRYLHQNK